jgi:mannitol-1-phosphate 5-dehydrogenase
MISRVVPLVKDDPLAMIAEDHNEWVVRRRDFMGSDPGLPYMTLIDDLEAYLERKLWIHNGGHATVAYAGLLRGHTYIHEACADPVVGELALAVLGELAGTITSKHGMPADEVHDYAMGLVGRGQLVEMRDELLRVVRDPIRKLGLKDRLVAPAVYAEEHGLPNGAIVRSIVNVLAYRRDSDAESGRMHRIIAEQGLRSFLEDTIGLKPHPTLVAKILAANQSAGLQRAASST